MDGMDEGDEVDEVDEVDEMDEVGEEVIDGWMMLVTEVEKYPIGQIAVKRGGDGTRDACPKTPQHRSFSQLPMDWPKLPGMRKEAHVAATTKTQHPIVSKTPNRVISNHIHT
ncbi:hypothetical protein PABG_12553 [Paracoccidioides brasiliensis Pb03]|nr:hypothetical protein PABG_12553 [Paracoccidioides brasiliensis Pb03]